MRRSSIEQLHQDVQDLLRQLDATSQLTNRDPAGTWMLAEFSDRTRLWVDLGDYGVSRGCISGNYEPIETGFIRTILKPGQAFVDIGANIGWFTVLAARAVGPSGQVYAFEPRPNTCERLQLSILENQYKNVEVRQAALGAAPGRMKIGTVISAHNPGGTWSLTTDVLVASLNAGCESFEVDVIRLDDIGLTRCDLIKIDIEGAEPLALAGAIETIKRLRPIILSEINPQPLRQVSSASAREYVEFVEGLGYQTHALTAVGPGAKLDTGFTDTLTDLVNVAFLPT